MGEGYREGPSLENIFSNGTPQERELDEIKRLTKKEREDLLVLLKKGDEAKNKLQGDDDENNEQIALKFYLEFESRLSRLKQERAAETMSEMAESARTSLVQALDSRFEEFESSYRFEIASPEVPETLTSEHLEALEKIFGKGNLEPMILPTAEELHNFDEEYQRVMYPKKKTKEDKRKGLISSRPGYCESAKLKRISTKSKETIGQACFRSMKEELDRLGGSFILTETILYNQKDGPDKDPLLSIFKKVLGEKVDRFNHDGTKLQEKLVPKVQEEIVRLFKERGLPVPSFEVTLMPALVFNLQTTLFYPENSQFGALEWASTSLTDVKVRDSAKQFLVGHKEMGGAANVVFNDSFVNIFPKGARLAIVFKQK